MHLTKSIPGVLHQNRIFLLKENADTAQLLVNDEERTYLLKKLNQEQHLVEINRFTSKLLIVSIPSAKNEYSSLEAWRRQGNEVAQWAKAEKINTIEVTSFSGNVDILLAFAEGVMLGSYQFLKYNSKAEKIRTSLTEICFSDDQLSQTQLDELSVLTDAVFKARDLINEPVISLNAEMLGSIFLKMSNEVGIHTEILGKNQIEALGMGGLLAVNKGSLDPPTFSVLEWKPKQVLNNQPIVIVGKGVVFDTGGLSLKPTAKSMDYMKSDMAGAAAVAAAICVAARKPSSASYCCPGAGNRQPSGRQRNHSRGCHHHFKRSNSRGIEY